MSSYTYPPPRMNNYQFTANLVSSVTNPSEAPVQHTHTLFRSHAHILDYFHVYPNSIILSTYIKKCIRAKG